MNTTEPVEITLDTSTVLAKQAAPNLEWVEVEGEVVAWNAEAAELHRLDPIATLVFQLCDGRTDLGQTVVELAEAFDQPRQRVEADVLGCASQLHRDGLVVEVDQ